LKGLTARVEVAAGGGDRLLVGDEWERESFLSLISDYVSLQCSSEDVVQANRNLARTEATISQFQPPRRHGSESLPLVHTRL
jgi:hypothetical protein